MRRTAILVALGVGVAAATALGVAACAGGAECRLNSECRYGSYCLGGTCFSECQQDMDCMHGLVCDTIFGRCTTPDTDGGIHPHDGPPPEDGAQQHDGSVQHDAAVQTDGPDGGGQGQYTDPCAHATDCASALCLGDPHYGDGHCLPAMCSAITGCQTGDICVEYPPLTLPSCVPSDIGKPCNGTGQCLYSCAYNQLQGIGICTNPCSMAADCPAGFTCSPYGSPVTMLCMPPDVTSCTTHDDCVFTVNATGGIAACVTLSGTPPGRCLNTCRTAADCPADYGCQNLGASYSVCVPPATGNATLGEACAGDALCRSNLCLAGVCTDRCGVTHAGQFCPYDTTVPIAYGCLPMTVGGSEKLVCVPTAGTGDVGATCVDQSNCRTALCLTDNNNQTYCTKFCNDGVCRTGWTCEAVGQTVDGVALKACVRP